MYLFLKYLHILLSILAIGCTATYGLWFALAKNNPKDYGIVLRGVSLLDDRLATPCYLGAAATGLGLVWLGGMGWGILWIQASLALTVLNAAVGLGLNSPLLRRQMAAHESGGPGDPEFLRLSKAGARLGLAMDLVMLLILYFMIYKPAGGNS